jgi:hypothetical protein
VRSAILIAAAVVASACSGSDAEGPPTPVDPNTLRASYTVTLTRVSSPQSQYFACAPISIGLERTISWDATGCGADLVAFGIVMAPTSIEVYTRPIPRYRGIKFTNIVGDRGRTRLTSDWEGRTCNGLVSFPPEPCVVESGTAVWVMKPATQARAASAHRSGA